MAPSTLASAKRAESGTTPTEDGAAIDGPEPSTGVSDEGRCVDRWEVAMAVMVRAFPDLILI